MSMSNLLYWDCSKIPADLPKRRARLWRLNFALADSYQDAHAAPECLRSNRLDEEVAQPWFVMFLAREPSQAGFDTLDVDLD